MTKPLVSIITVVFNGQAMLEDTIRSVGGQRFKDVEYILVDGGSKDGTLDIIRRHEGTVTRWISEPDKGVYDAMNKGIRMATGQWLYFLGSDDSFRDENVLTGFFGKDPRADADLVYGDVLSPSYRGRYDGPFTYGKLLSRNLSHQAAFYRKELFDRLGYYDPRYRMHADWDFNLRCFADPTVRTSYTGILVASFGEGGISAGHDLLFLRERLIPAKLEALRSSGVGTLRNLGPYDEWWRFLRNAGFRDQQLLQRSMKGETLLPSLERMLRWQRIVPAGLLKNGVFSKGWMFASYLTNRLTAAI